MFTIVNVGEFTLFQLCDVIGWLKLIILHTLSPSDNKAYAFWIDEYVYSYKTQWNVFG